MCARAVALVLAGDDSHLSGLSHITAEFRRSSLVVYLICWRKQLEDIKNIERFCEPPKSGLYCDLLWSDPVAKDDGKSVLPYTANTGRGCSYYFGIDAVNRFLEDNNLLTIIRGHEAQLDGYKIHRWENSAEFPSVITIFSCPNYCDVYNNKGAILKIQVPHLRLLHSS